MHANVLSKSAPTEQLNIPADVEFSFELVLPGNRTIGPREAVNIGANVYSKTKRVEVLRSSGIPQFGDLTVSVW